MGREKMKKREYVPYTNSCFACGDENESGLRLELFEEGGRVKGSVSIDEHLNGYAGMVHGGIICALLDEAMIWSAVVFGGKRTMYVTAEMRLRFLAPVPVSQEISVSGWVVEDRGRFVICDGEVERDGSILATGSGKFLALGEEKLKEIHPQLKYGRCTKYKDFLKSKGGQKG